MLISVIILGYNGRQYVDGCLQTVLDQDLSPAQHCYEVIWADNCSSDEAPDYIERAYPSVQVIRLKHNYGFAQGNNLAAAQARGELLVFLNQDTIVHRSWLRALVEAMCHDSGLAACQSNMLMPWHEEFKSFERIKLPQAVYVTRISRYGYVEYRQLPYTDDLLPTVFLTGASFAIRRSVVEQMPYIFDPFFNTYSEDLELSLRLAALGWRAATAPNSVVYHLQYSKIPGLRAAVRKAYLPTRNRVLAYYKNLPASAFVRMLPRLFAGAFSKISELPLAGRQKVISMLAMGPIAVVAFGAAGVHSRRYGAYRRELQRKIASGQRI